MFCNQCSLPSIQLPGLASGRHEACADGAAEPYNPEAQIIGILWRERETIR